MKRTFGAILFVIYSIIAIGVTVLLLSYNDYNCSEIGQYTVFILKEDALEPEFEQGSILLIKGTSDKKVQIGDELFLYKVHNSSEFELVTGKLARKTQQGRQIVYEMEDGSIFDSEYFVGRIEDSSVIGAPWGTVLSILESKWGYLFCIVIVSLLLFLQEVFDLIIELRYGGTKGTKAANVADARKKANKKPAGTKTTTAKKTTAKKVATVAVPKNTETKVEEEVK